MRTFPNSYCKKCGIKLEEYCFKSRVGTDKSLLLGASVKIVLNKRVEGKDLADKYDPPSFRFCEKCTDQFLDTFMEKNINIHQRATRD